MHHPVRAVIYPAALANAIWSDCGSAPGIAGATLCINPERVAVHMAHVIEARAAVAEYFILLLTVDNREYQCGEGGHFLLLSGYPANAAVWSDNAISVPTAQK